MSSDLVNKLIYQQATQQVEDHLNLLFIADLHRINHLLHQNPDQEMINKLMGALLNLKKYVNIVEQKDTVSGCIIYKSLIDRFMTGTTQLDQLVIDQPAVIHPIVEPEQPAVIHPIVEPEQPAVIHPVVEPDRSSRRSGHYKNSVVEPDRSSRRSGHYKNPRRDGAMRREYYYKTYFCTRCMYQTNSYDAISDHLNRHKKQSTSVPYDFRYNCATCKYRTISYNRIVHHRSRCNGRH